MEKRRLQTRSAPKALRAHAAAALIGAALAFQGCAALEKPPVGLETPPPVEDARKAGPPVETRAPGSLYSDSGLLGDLYTSFKARRKGDILTVRIVESSSAANEASTQTGRKSDYSAGVDQLMGIETWWVNEILPDVNDRYPKINPFGPTSVSAGMESGFDGSGATSRSGVLTALLTVTVMEVLPNGNLYIQGSKEVGVNYDKHIITLSGIVRPKDLTPENVVLSTAIAEARITYDGDGVIQTNQRPGWLADFLNVIWPF